MFKKYIFILSTLLISSNALAQWTLVNDESTVNYISIKSSKVSELNHFNTLSGTLNDNGSLSVDIDLASVETNIPIRNERVKTILFETSSFTKANILANLDLNKLNALNIGDTYTTPIKFKLSLHGVSKEITADIRVVKLTNDKLLAFSSTPIIIDAEQYNLAEGINKLRDIAKLPSISTTVPVSFSLIFDKK
ncbi:YceI family protein [Colwellia sp. MSW7]|uniref:YceI family protein n=1 Tax=Colwellia maritima TaxID=2912588 RepID=A0ABS9X2Y3_9GAMM|nr:YceI family protein [Colwellia maritima]MCI2284445.1 YceI family protein [Colwellia maritima]